MSQSVIAHVITNPTEPNFGRSVAFSPDGTKCITVCTLSNRMIGSQLIVGGKAHALVYSFNSNTGGVTTTQAKPTDPQSWLVQTEDSAYNVDAIVGSGRHLLATPVTLAVTNQTTGAQLSWKLPDAMQLGMLLSCGWRDKLTVE